MAALSWLVALFAIPTVWVLVDVVGALRGGRATTGPVVPADRSAEPRFVILVPIYGVVRYLENVGYLADYADRVVLCTTMTEADAFYRDLHAIADQYGFRVFRGAIPISQRHAGGSGRRATSGTIRDRLIRDALQYVDAPYVICLDADTTTTRPLGDLVATFAAQGFDFASIRLVPSNTATILGRLQAYEYRLSMQMRRIAPWMVSGACHIARTHAHQEIMRRHTLFFQGNDVEAGLLAAALGYRVGHIPFDVPTAVPDTVKGWFRQRLAWAGGEFRLFVINIHLARQHPWLWTYGTLICLAGLPFRWMSLTHPAIPLAMLAAGYLAACLYLHRSKYSWHLLLLPLYTAFSSLIMTPLGIIWYTVMAVRDRNIGYIHTTKTPVGSPGPTTEAARRPAADTMLLPRLGHTPVCPALPSLTSSPGRDRLAARPPAANHRSTSTRPVRTTTS